MHGSKARGGNLAATLYAARQGDQGAYIGAGFGGIDANRDDGSVCSGAVVVLELSGAHWTTASTD